MSIPTGSRPDRPLPRRPDEAISPPRMPSSYQAGSSKLKSMPSPIAPEVAYESTSKTRSRLGSTWESLKSAGNTLLTKISAIFEKGMANLKSLDNTERPVDEDEVIYGKPLDSDKLNDDGIIYGQPLEPDREHLPPLPERPIQGRKPDHEL